MRLLSGCFMCVMLAGCTNEDERACTLIGCVSQISIEAKLSDAPAKIEVELCFNSRCAIGNEIAVGSHASVEGDVTFHVGPGVNGGILILVPLGLNAISPKNGDLVSVRIVDLGTNQTIVDESSGVTYETYFPNGPECDPGCIAGGVQVGS